MVEIREESTEPMNGNGTSSSAGGASSSTSRPTPSQNGSAGHITLSQFVSENTVDCCLFFTRLMTVFCSLFFLLPMLSPISAESAYFKALAAAAATNALRMHQRVGPVSFSREFLGRLMLEDSCHYLFYSVLFLFNSPVTMCLLPVALYAALHASSFAIKVLNATGRGNSAIAHKLTGLVQAQTQNCLGIVACAEIFLVPIIISLIFVGKVTIMIPFVYYRFLTLRYSSRRNPYTRQAFAQMRFSLDQVSMSPRCPQIARTLIQKSISVISGLAPAYA